MELEDCNEGTLNNLEALRAAMLTAADEAGATILGESFHRFSPHGISGVVVIAESHLCIHTWPEHGYAAADIFTCGTTVQPEKAAEVLVEKLGARKHLVHEIPRGLRVAERARLG
jgi:S-adenosylmethionine decarboxylase proenzyme